MGLFDKFKKKKIEMTDEEEMYFYTEQEINEYECYIQENFGGYKEVLHEIVSPDIHLDIIVIEPNEKSNYYSLCGAFLERKK